MERKDLPPLPEGLNSRHAGNSGFDYDPKNPTAYHPVYDSHKEGLHPIVESSME